MLLSADQDVSNDRTAYGKILCLVLRVKFRLSFGSGEQRAVPSIRPSCSGRRVGKGVPGFILCRSNLSRSNLRGILHGPRNSFFHFYHQQRGQIVGDRFIGNVELFSGWQNCKSQAMGGCV